MIPIFLMSTFSQKGSPKPDVSYRPATVAGAFYPDNADTLRKILLDYLDLNGEMKIPASEEIIGIVAPHAGYVYSGWVAGKAYRELYGRKYDAVIIISPSHQKSFSGSSVFSGDAYVTPLGNALTDKTLAFEIASFGGGVKLSLKGHEWTGGSSEHSIEVQIPFLQIVLPEIPIVPICMGSHDFEAQDELMKAISIAAKKLAKKVLIVASSDLSHFHDDSTARALDWSITDAFSNFDYFRMAMEFSARKTEACGAAPIVATMLATEQLGADKSYVMQYATSADSPTERTPKSRVVGYMSGILTKSGKERVLLPEIDDYTKEQILELARNTVESTIMGTKPVKINSKLSPIFNSNFAVFVTLTKKGNLRGCIGHTFSTQPLADEIAESARLAATSDWRFGAVKKSELDSLEYEVTILSRMKRQTDTSKIVIGRDGLYLRLGSNSGLLLPQVASERRWNTQTFLENLSQKAGLDKYAYKDPKAQLFYFNAVILSEKD